MSEASSTPTEFPLSAVPSGGVDAPSPRPGRRKAEQKLRQLIRDKKYKRAEAFLVGVISDIESAPPWQLALRAELHDARGEFRRGLVCWQRAFAADKKSARYAAECILSLAILNCFRQAFQFYKKLPSKQRKSREVRDALVRVYDWIGWPGHHYKARRKAGHNDSSIRARVKGALLRLILPLVLRFERNKRNRLAMSRESFIYLKEIPYRTIEQRYDTYAEVDSALRALAQVRARGDILGGLFNWLIPALFIATIALIAVISWQPPQNLLYHILVSLMFGGAAYFILLKIIWRLVRGYYLSITVMFALSLTLIGLATSTSNLPSAAILNSATLQISLLSAALVGAATPALVLLVNAFEDYALRRTRYRHARGIIIDLLIDALIAIDEIPKRRGQSTGRLHLQRIESIAVILERGVPSQGRSQEAHTDQWLKDICSRGAVALRLTKRRVFSSKVGTWEKDVRRTLLQTLHAAATENWTALPQRNPPERSITPRSVRVRSIARSLSVALLPAAALALTVAVADVPPSILGWAQIIVVAWTVVCLLLIVDPGIREKINAARDVAETLRGLTSSSGRDTATRPSSSPYS